MNSAITYIQPNCDKVLTFKLILRNDAVFDLKISLFENSSSKDAKCSKIQKIGAI